MNYTNNRNLLRWFLIVTSFVIISLILWNTYIFFQNFKAEERAKMRNWSFAYNELNKSEDLDINIGDLHLEIMQNNSTTPMIVVDANGKIQQIKNINETKNQDSVYLYSLLEKFSKENNPIDVIYKDEVYQTLYYGNSPLLNKLKYYPLALLLIIILFAAVVYFFYRSSKIAIQNKLWSGMAKETAHQIGTPLSSLVGWTELLKSENINQEHVKEIEKDIYRLQTITDRFSKIGSMPKLKKTNIIKATEEAYSYLKSRSSKLIEFDFEAPDETIYVDLNEQLYSWTIENLVKNAIDAMKGKGKLSIKISTDVKHVYILVSDTGKGIKKHLQKTIFEPGYTSKKRGWGLGLSLAKRIIEDYHDGRIKVLHSEVGKGTTIQVLLKVITN